MRIISQDKTEDIPYEIARLYISSVHAGTIYAELAGMSDATLLGDYYTQEDAMTVLADIAKGYLHGEKIYYCMPSADHVAKKRLNSEEKSNS